MIFNNFMHSMEFSRNCIKKSLTYVDFRECQEVWHVLYFTDPFRQYRFSQVKLTFLYPHLSEQIYSDVQIMEESSDKLKKRLSY